MVRSPPAIDLFVFAALCNTPAAVQYYDFAENQCEIVTFSARALTERPYIENRNSSLNYNLTFPGDPFPISLYHFTKLKR